MKFGKFLLSRIATFLLVIFIGVTTVFFVPRLMPNDPVEAMIGQMTSNAGSMSPEDEGIHEFPLRPGRFCHAPISGFF